MNTQLPVSKKTNYKHIILMTFIVSCGLYEIFTIAFTQNAFALRPVIEDYSESIGLRFGDKLRETQIDYSDLYRLQRAIATCEGSYKEGSLSQRNNNPGNLKAGGNTDPQRHTIYPTRVEGYLAHLELLQRRYWGHSTYYMNHTLGYATDPDWYKCVDKIMLKLKHG